MLTFRAISSLRTTPNSFVPLKLHLVIFRRFLMADYSKLPANLPIPKDDGAADHLKGMKLPNILLKATTGATINPSVIEGRLVIFCYPMTGQPNVPLPPGWDQIPGARGCTPQSCAFRDNYEEIKSLGAKVIGLSVQSTEYQLEMVQRLHLPFPVVSDVDYQFQKALNLPCFEVSGMKLLKRITLVANNGVIEAVHYPIFPSDSDPAWVKTVLQSHKYA